MKAAAAVPGADEMSATARWHRAGRLGFHAHRPGGIRAPNWQSATSTRCWVVGQREATKGACRQRSRRRTHRGVARALAAPDNLIVLGNDPYMDRCARHPLPPADAGDGMDEEQWQIFRRGRQSRRRAGEGETGLVHGHPPPLGTWIETPEETVRLLKMTDPAVLGLCFDTGHYTYGGGDPLTGLKRYADRIWHVHLRPQNPRSPPERAEG